MSGKNCPGSHGLQLFNTPKASYGCDGCEKIMKLNSKMYGCRKCNYDLCEDCYLFQPHNINGCEELARLAEHLAKYTNEEKFDDEFNITNILNDFHHLLHEHDDDDAFEYICNFIGDLGKCNINQCTQFRRNYCMANKYTQVTAKEHILDQIHCYLLHSYDIGFRLRKEDFNEMNEAKYSAEKPKISMKAINISEQQNIINKRIIDTKKRLSADIQELVNYKSNNKFNQLKGLPSTKEETFNKFDFGWRYFYWDAHKNMHEQYACYDINAGSTVKQFCVSHKFKSFKDELTQNDIIRITSEVWNSTWRIALEKHKSNDGKTFKADPFEQGDFLTNRAMYGIKKDTPMETQHLMAVILYCDFSDLSTKFSESFRLKSNEFESFNELKERHCNFYFWSRYLHEAIHCFSQPAFAQSTRKFYHGIDDNMIFDSVECMMHQPFSTTSSWAVAVNFSATTGMVIELNPNPLIKYFDCDWLSRFAGEREKLFLGCSRTMTFTNITNIFTSNNYEIYIKCISIIDTLTKGTFYQNDDDNFSYSKYYGNFFNQWYNSKSGHTSYNFAKEIPLSESCKELTRKMIEHQLSRYDLEQSNKKRPSYSYIEQVLHNVCTVKTKVSINWQSLQVHMKEDIIDYKNPCMISEFNGKYCGYSFLKDLLCTKNAEMVNLKFIKTLFPNVHCILLNGLDVLTNYVLDTVFSFLWQLVSPPIVVFELRLSGKGDNPNDKLKAFLNSYKFQEKNEYIMGLKFNANDTVVIKKRNHPLSIVPVI